MEHLPEQYSVPGIANGQRWRSTPKCREQRTAEHEILVPVENVISYLLAHPLRETYRSFLDLNSRLRSPEPSAGRMEAFYELLETRASPRARVSDDVVPWRPNRGIYLLVEELTADSGAEREFASLHKRQTPDLLETPGVAGLWLFGSSSDYPGGVDIAGTFRISILYLDSDPATVAASIAPKLRERWESLPGAPWLAAPFESIVEWNWRRLLEPAGP